MCDTDILEGDPLGGVCISQEGVLERDRFVFELAFERGIPICMVSVGSSPYSFLKETASKLKQGTADPLGGLSAQDQPSDCRLDRQPVEVVSADAGRDGGVGRCGGRPSGDGGGHGRSEKVEAQRRIAAIMEAEWKEKKAVHTKPEGHASMFLV